METEAETDPDFNSDPPTESNDKESDGQKEEIDKQTDTTETEDSETEEPVDDQDFGDETISDEKLLEEETQKVEEDVTNLVREAESNFDPATLWALTKQLKFLQGYKAIDQDFTDDEINNQSQEYGALKAEIASVNPDGEL